MGIRFFVDVHWTRRNPVKMVAAHLLRLVGHELVGVAAVVPQPSQPSSLIE